MTKGKRKRVGAFSFFESWGKKGGVKREAIIPSAQKKKQKESNDALEVIIL
jgi:hypothetical protein